MTTARAAALNGGTGREPAAKSVQNPCTCSALVLRADSGFDLVMSDEQLPDPNTPEWSVAWAAREVLRRHLGPRYDRNLPSFPRKGGDGADAPQRLAADKEAAEPTALNLRSPAGPQIGVAMARAAGNHPVLSDLGHREVINVACSFCFKCG